MPSATPNATPKPLSCLGFAIGRADLPHIVPHDMRSFTGVGAASPGQRDFGADRLQIAIEFTTAVDRGMVA
jgi:hypothetical protein